MYCESVIKPDNASLRNNRCPVYSNQFFVRSGLKRIIAISLFLLFIQTAAHAEVDQVCRAWFGTLGISKGDPQCSAKCVAGEVGMATYSCPVMALGRRSVWRCFCK